MELVDFFDRIEAESQNGKPVLEGLGIGKHEGRDMLYVKYIPTGLTTCLPADAVKKADWSVIKDILVGAREPHVLHHMTRVVGYYSRIENWNPSKLAELEDRRKGTYAMASTSAK